jgi:hypothetical protein
MKWFDQWFYGKCRWAWDRAQQEEEDDNDTFNLSLPIDNKIKSQGFKLEVYRATGGLVVESTVYDAKLDDDRHGLYVINDDADLGRELAKIITVERLKL